MKWLKVTSEGLFLHKLPTADFNRIVYFANVKKFVC